MAIETGRSHDWALPRMSDSAQQRVYPTRRRQSVSQHVRNRWVMCGKCSPVSCGAGPCPARPRAAATSFFRACAGAIEKANRPSPETRAGTSRHGPCCAARKSGRTPHIHNPSTEPALLRVDCNSLTALRIIRSRNPSEQASGSEMKTPPKPHSISAVRWALPMVVDCLEYVLSAGRAN